MKNQYIASFVVLSLCTQYTQAQPNATVYALSDIVAMALRENPLLISHQANVEVNQLAGQQLNNWTGPSVEFSVGRRSVDSSSGSRYEADLSQPLPVLGKQKLRGHSANLDAESWAIQREASESLIALNVVRLSIEYVNNRRWADYVEKRQRRFSLFKSYLEGRVFPSPQKKTESQIVQNRLRTLLSENLQAQADFQSSFESLRAFAPMEAADYPNIEIPWFSGTTEFNADESMKAALQNNFDLRLREIAVKNAEVQNKLASKDSLPEPKITASYEKANTTESETNTGVGLGLDFSSWNGNRFGRKSAEKKLFSEQNLRSQQQRQINAELPEALLQYEAARNAVREYPASLLNEIESQLRVSEEGFRKGQVDLLTFLELDDSSAEMFHHILDAQIKFAEKATNLFRLMGDKEVLAKIESL